jgi:hypothetical protein
MVVVENNRLNHAKTANISNHLSFSLLVPIEEIDKLSGLVSLYGSFKHGNMLARLMEYTIGCTFAFPFSSKLPNHITLARSAGNSNTTRRRFREKQRLFRSGTFLHVYTLSR